MRTAGMNLPVTDGYMKAISAGPSQPLAKVTDGSVGNEYWTPEQQAFRNERKLYGGDDPQMGGYNLAQIDWDKEDGRLSVGHLEPTPNGWISLNGIYTDPD